MEHNWNEQEANMSSIKLIQVNIQLAANEWTSSSIARWSKALQHVQKKYSSYWVNAVEIVLIMFCVT